MKIVYDGTYECYVKICEGIGEFPQVDGFRNGPKNCIIGDKWVLTGNAVEIYSDGKYMILADTPTEFDELPTSKFQKDDSSKNRLELIDPEFILGLGRIMTFGATKYAPDNWKLGSDQESINRLKGALLRHITAYLSGDKIDTETGESHLYHAAFGLQALAYFDRNSDNVNK